MLLKIGAVLASIPLAMVGVVAGTGVAVVDVKTHDGPRIVVPVPLLLVEAAARMAPERTSERALRAVERGRKYLPVAEEVLAALAEAPDAELVRVEDGRDFVRISKVGDTIEIRVDGPGEQVSVDVPLAMVQDALRQARRGTLDIGDLVAGLRHARMTDLVVVNDGDDRVKISVW
jgi:hypothetical protein